MENRFNLIINGKYVIYDDHLISNYMQTFTQNCGSSIFCVANEQAYNCEPSPKWQNFETLKKWLKFFDRLESSVYISLQVYLCKNAKILSFSEFLVRFFTMSSESF